MPPSPPLIGWWGQNPPTPEKNNNLFLQLSKTLSRNVHLKNWSSPWGEGGSKVFLSLIFFWFPPKIIEEKNSPEKNWPSLGEGGFFWGRGAKFPFLEGNFSVPLWSKLDFCPCTRNWTKLNNFWNLTWKELLYLKQTFYEDLFKNRQFLIQSIKILKYIHPVKWKDFLSDHL